MLQQIDALSQEDFGKDFDFSKSNQQSQPVNDNEFEMDDKQTLLRKPEKEKTSDVRRRIVNPLLLIDPTKMSLDNNLTSTTPVAIQNSPEQQPKAAAISTVLPQTQAEIDAQLATEQQVNTKPSETPRLVTTFFAKAPDTLPNTTEKDAEKAIALAKQIGHDFTQHTKEENAEKTIELTKQIVNDFNQRFFKPALRPCNHLPRRSKTCRKTANTPIFCN